MMQAMRVFKTSLAWMLLRQFRTDIVWVMLFSMLVNILTLAPTLYMMQIYDRILLGKSLTSLLIISMTIGAFLLLMTYADIIRSKILIMLGNKIEVRLSDTLFQASLKQFLTDKAKEPSVYLRAMVEFKQFIAGVALVCFFDILWSPVYVAISYLLHPMLGAFSLTIVAVQIILLWANHRSSVNLANSQLELHTRQQQFMYANLRNLLPVFAMGYSSPFKVQWLSAQYESLSLGIEIKKRNLRMQGLIKYFRYAIQTLSLGLGAYLAIHGEISIGSMIAANVIMARALMPFDQLTGVWPQWIAFLRSNQLLSGLFEQNVSGRTPSQPADACAQPMRIEASDFSAAYVADKPVIHHMHFLIEAGDVLAVMGKSGSGKTTLIKALMGLTHISSGSLHINNQDVFAGQTSPLASLVGYLPQDFQLFEGTVAENIARFGITDSEAITRAAIQAGVHEWILRLPQGYDTMIGPFGQVLSGGQKQQLGLARAIYGNARLIVLDEPNANLDEAGERALHQLLLLLKQQQKIVLVVSHREQVLHVVDKILWIDEGKQMAFGSKDEVRTMMKAQRDA